MCFVFLPYFDSTNKIPIALKSHNRCCTSYAAEILKCYNACRGMLRGMLENPLNLLLKPQNQYLILVLG